MTSLEYHDDDKADQSKNNLEHNFFINFFILYIEIKKKNTWEMGLCRICDGPTQERLDGHRGKRSLIKMIRN